MFNQTAVKNQTHQDSTKCLLPFFVEEEVLSVPGILEGGEIELGTIFHFEIPQAKKKLWGLFKGLKFEEEEIEEAKKSLFPEREF